MKKINIPITEFKDNLNKISPSFCAAKWKQVTMHLQTGHTHSCHHPVPHKIPLDEVRENPSALHNTQFKKEQRKLMLEGSRPSECDYCWRVEDTGDHLSDRIYKSADNWAEPYINDIVSKPWDDNVDPSYVEVSFGNVCNFKCSYCSPNISSQWMEEIERYGPYQTSGYFNNLDWLKRQDQMPIPHKDHNPYVDAFWQWWPKMYNSLHHFRITGGEPLLNKNTFKVLDYIIENPNPNLEVSINTNMNPPKDLFDKFLEKVKIIIDEKKVKRFKIFTSAEAHGKQAEYIRHGLNYDDWISNIHRTYKEIPEIQFTVMSTYNILSTTTYTKFLQDILDIKREYGTTNYNPIILDIPYLRYPAHQAVFIAEPEHLQMIYDQITFMCLNLEHKGWYGSANRGFYEDEAEKLKRIYTTTKWHIDNPRDEENKVHRKDFAIFVDEHDSRRGTQFLSTFPEMENFYNLCKTY